MRVGIRVTCSVCGHMKKPHGRSAPMLMHYCDENCGGYYMPPLPGCLWPEETEKEFGYHVCSNAVRIDGGSARVPKGFAVSGKASEAGKKSAEKRWGKK